MNSASSSTNELLEVTQRLLNAIATGDWNTYDELCDPSLTCFEPEARGHLVEGLAFHRFYFEHKSNAAPHTTICSPHVRIVGDSAIVCYNRLTQLVDESGSPVSSATQETRVWKRSERGWRLVHFHRSKD